MSFTRTQRLERAAMVQSDNYAMAMADHLNARAARFDGFKMWQEWEEATPAEQRSFYDLEPELISVEEFNFLLTLSARFNTALTRRLRAEDFNFIANARCMFIDALDCAGMGNIDEAFLFITQSVKKLDFVVNKRKRNAENRDYHNIPEYPRIWQDLRLLLEDMQRAQAMLERAHKAAQR